MDLAGEYAALIRQALNVDKSAAWATTTAAQASDQAQWKEYDICWTQVCIWSPGFVSIDIVLENDVARKACEEGIVIAKRMQWTSLSMFQRV